MATLVINRDSLGVRLEANHLVVHEHADGSCRRVPLVDIERVIVVGQPAITFPVFVKLLDLGIPCSFLTHGGRWRGCRGRHRHRRHGHSGQGWRGRSPRALQAQYCCRFGWNRLLWCHQYCLWSLSPRQWLRGHLTRFLAIKKAHDECAVHSNI